MGTKKISALNAATALTGNEVIPIVQSGETKKSTFILALENVLRQVVSNTTSFFAGKDAGKLNTGQYNVAIGYEALSTVSANIECTAVGFRALKNNIDTGGLPAGAYNTAVGANSMLENTTGNHNTAVGWWSLKNNTTGSNNTAIGQDCLLSNTIGSNNTALGMHCLDACTEGNENMAIGADALGVLSTGSANTAVGLSSLDQLTTGTDNVAIGKLAGHGGAGSEVLTHTKCTFVGKSSTSSNALVAGAFTNMTCIGYGAVGYGSNAVYIGDYNITDVYLGNINVAAEAKLHCGRLHLSNIPTGAGGLVAGDVWSNGGVLTLVS